MREYVPTTHWETRLRLGNRSDSVKAGPAGIALDRPAGPAGARARPVLQRLRLNGLVAMTAMIFSLGVLAAFGWIFVSDHEDGILTLFDGYGDLLLKLLRAVAIIVFAGWVAGHAVKLIGQPRVIGEIFMGIMLGPTLFGQLAPGLQQDIFRPSLMPYLNGIASIGVAIFMFLVGFEVSFGRLRSAGRTIGTIGFSMIAIPFGCGVLVAILLAERYRPGSAPFSAFLLFTGVAMGVTAFPVLARILRDRGLMESRLGTLGLISAGVGDLLAWCLLAVTIAVARGTSPAGVTLTIVSIAAFMVVALGLRRVLPHFFAIIDTHRGGRLAVIPVVLLVGVSFAWFTEFAGVHAIFGAFMAGAILPRDTPAVRHVIRFATGGVLLALPLFFATVGFRIDVNLSTGTALVDALVCLLVIVVAVVSKLAATTLATRAGQFSWRDRLGLGVMMNCRGLTELVVLSTGLTLGIISQNLFAIFVVMTLVTTAMTAPLLGALRLQRHASRSAVTEDSGNTDNRDAGQGPAKNHDGAAEQVLSDVRVPERPLAEIGDRD
jgi:Kef-type K+ transport system membrane component KefB